MSQESLHRLLLRQLKKLPQQPDTDDALSDLLKLVSDAYTQSDVDRKLLERSLELTSAELTARNRELKQQLDDQQQMQDALQHSHSLLRASLNATHDGICVVGLDQKIKLVNEVFQELFGFHVRYWSKQALMNRQDHAFPICPTCICPLRGK